MALDDRREGRTAMIIDDSTGILRHSALEQFYILNLFKYKTSAFISDPNQMSFQSTRRGNLLDHYTWDIMALADSLSAASVETLKYIESNSNLWKPMLIDNFSHDQSDRFIQPVDTFNPVSTFAHALGTNLQTTTKFTYPVITQNFEKNQDYNDAFLKSQNVLYDAFILPGCPLLITSTLYNSLILGPQFVKGISITVNDKSPVTIEVDTVGGRTLTSSPKKRTELKKEYRTAKSYDCGLEFIAHKTCDSFFRKILSISRDKIVKIISMSLNVQNEYDVKFTGINYINFTKNGPRYFTVKRRTITGQISFFANSSEYFFNTLNNPILTGLTMYFGGIFLFILPNVTWQYPTIKISNGGLYLHEYKFIAFASENALANSYKALKAGSTDISEFVLPEDNLNLDLKIIVDLQKSLTSEE